MTNTYFVGSPNQATVKIQDSDQPSNVVPVANLHTPVGIDYHPVISNLIVSVNYSGDSTQGVPVNFARLDSSGNSNAWTTLGSMGPPDTEIKLATVKIQDSKAQGRSFPTSSLMALPSARPAALAWTALMTCPICFLPVAPVS